MSRQDEILERLEELHDYVCDLEEDELDEALSAFWGKKRWEKEAGRTAELVGRERNPEAWARADKLSRDIKAMTPKKPSKLRSAMRMLKKRFKRTTSPTGSNIDKRVALVNKLRKQKGVRDPEALAAWIGKRVGGTH